MVASAYDFWLTVFGSGAIAVGIVRPLITLAIQHAGYRVHATRFVINIVSVPYQWIFAPRTLVGRWVIEWEVDSNSFDNANLGTSEVRRSFTRITAAAPGVRGGKTVTNYAFVGVYNAAASTITGEWYDIEDRVAGYSGVFQLKLSGTRDRAEGVWTGPSDGGSIKTGRLVWKLQN